MSKSVLIIIIFISSAIILSVVQIGFSAVYTTAGIDLSQVQTQTTELEKQNAILSEAVYTKAALTNVAQEATALGMTDSTKKSRLVLSAPIPFAYNQ